MRGAVQRFKDRYVKKAGIIAAEVGAGRGVNCLDMLSGIDFKKLYMVENNGWGGSPRSYLDAVAEKYPCCEVITKASVDAAKDIADESLDFVYIDADHKYESVKADINAWYPKVKVGGWIMMHDYNLNPEVGVPMAANEFVKAHGIEIEGVFEQAMGECIFLRKP